MAHQLNVEISREYAKLVDAKPRECYSNSLFAFSGLSADKKFSNSFYCEGYAASEGLMIPIHHGWIETTLNGQEILIDPTWCYKDERIVFHSLVRLTDKDVSSLFKRRSSIKTPVSEFYGKELMEKGLMQKLTNVEFIEMLNAFHLKLNEATKTIGE